MKLRDLWKLDTPHFGGIGPHRYDYGQTCVYCGRPKNWKAKLTVNEKYLSKVYTANREKGDE